MAVRVVALAATVSCGVSCGFSPNTGPRQAATCIPSVEGGATMSVVGPYGPMTTSGGCADAGPDGGSNTIAADSGVTGNVLIADQFNNRIIEVTRDGNIVWSFGDGTNSPGPTSIVGPNDAERLPNGETLMSGTGAPAVPLEDLTVDDWPRGAPPTQAVRITASSSSTTPRRLSSGSTARTAVSLAEGLGSSPVRPPRSSSRHKTVATSSLPTRATIA